jgi:predicted N-acyltransferase
MISSEAEPRIEIRDGLADIDPAAWDALTDATEPFLRHAFLEGLERHDCLGRRYGWFPQHVLAFRGDRLAGAAPCYAKTNNYGEFVFDWAWQSAWERHGQPYYPKLVISVPYTPATGPRLLVHPDEPDRSGLQRQLLDAAIARGEQLGASGVHVLFPEEREASLGEAAGLFRRIGCQYHWENAGYADFDAFLEALTSKKRKNIRRERRRVAEQGVAFRTLTGATADPADWARFHRFYEDTFEKHMGVPTLSQAFFIETAAALGPQVVLFEARMDDRTIAAALCYRGHDTLYGRFWGCVEDLPDLHFETCYYQGIEFCIQQGLARFEPGAQGEHKIPRGFLPTRTASVHAVLSPGFQASVQDFCRREADMMEAQCAALMEHSPYRAED